MSWDIVNDLRKRHRAFVKSKKKRGFNKAEAERLGVTPGNISHILQYKTWVPENQKKRRVQEQIEALQRKQGQ